MKIPNILKKEWESMGFTVEYNDDGIDISQYTPYDQDWHLEIDADNLFQLIEKLQWEWQSFDVDYESSLWIGKDGHGMNGAPYHICDIVEDIQSCKDYIEGLYKSAQAYLSSSLLREADRLGWEILNAGPYRVIGLPILAVRKSRPDRFSFIEARRLEGTDLYVIMQAKCIDLSTRRDEGSATGFDEKTEAVIYSFYDSAEEFNNRNSSENRPFAVARCVYEDTLQLNPEFGLVDDATAEEILIAEMEKHGKAMTILEENL